MLYWPTCWHYWISGQSTLSFTIGSSITRSALKARPLGPRKATSISSHNDVRCGFTQLLEHLRSMPRAYSRTCVRSMNQCIQKARGSWLMSHYILICFTHASSRIKRKGLLIDVMFYSCTFYMRSVAGSRSTIIIFFIHNNHRRMKSMGHLYTHIHHIGIQQRHFHTYL
jgi:hypothetical protein